MATSSSSGSSRTASSALASGRRLAFAFAEYVKELKQMPGTATQKQLKKTRFHAGMDPAKSESLWVVLDCLESAYDFDTSKTEDQEQLSIRPLGILPVFNNGLQSMMVFFQCLMQRMKQ